MKNNFLKKQFKIFNSIIKTNFFFWHFLCYFILASFFGGILGASFDLELNSRFEHILEIFSFKNYFLITLILFLISNLYLYNKIGKNYLFKLRSTNEKKFNKQVALSIAFQNMILFIVDLAILLIIINIFSELPCSINFLEERNTYDIIYCIFYILRCFCWIEIFSLLQYYFFSHISRAFGTIISIIYFVFVYFNYYTPMEFPKIINNIGDISLKIHYFLHPIYYDNFLFEVVVSLLYILGAIVIIRGLFSIDFDFQKIKKAFLILKANILDIINLYKKVIIIYFIIIILLFIFYYLTRDTFFNIKDLLKIVGLNYSEEHSFLQLIIFIYYQIIMIYLSSLVIFDSLKQQAYTILLRIKPIYFLLIKIVSIYSVIILIKIISYLFLYMLFIFLAPVNLKAFIDILIVDILLTINISTFSILIFFFYNSFKKLRLLTIPIVVLGIYLTIKLINFNIPNTLLLISSLFIAFITIKIFEKNTISIFEKIG